MNQTHTRAWLEINLDTLAVNTRKLRQSLNQGVQIMAVIKADAYGQGASIIAKTLDEAGVDAFGLATLDEALEVRKACQTKPILLLGYLHPDEMDEALHNNITLTLYSTAQARAISQAAERLGKAVDVHIKIDTGMMRLGFLPGEEHQALQAAKLPGINPVGIFSHFAEANSHDTSFSQEQNMRFEAFISILEQNGLHIPIKHIANSPGVMHGGFEKNLVRVAVLLFGVSSFPGETMDKHGYPITLSLKTRVSMIKTIPKGTPVGYGRNYYTKEETRVATISIGYADGYMRGNSNNGIVLIRGERARIIGNICMDQSMVDVTHIPDVNENDEVVIFGIQGSQEITLPELARLQGTIVHEVISNIGMRVPRIYFKEGECIGSVNMVRRQYL